MGSSDHLPSHANMEEPYTAVLPLLGLISGILMDVLGGLDAYIHTYIYPLPVQTRLVSTKVYRELVRIA